jgi:hypothetical protein
VRPLISLASLALAFATSSLALPTQLPRHLQAQSPLAHLPNGQPVDSLAPPGTRAVVLYFVASDCPISNRTFPEMQRVREEFASQPVRFWFVYPNTGETASIVQQHQAAFDSAGQVLLDTTGRLTRLTGVRATPEVAILEPRPAADGETAWTTVYAGRVDNRYVRLGLERPHATEHFAERVVREVLDGRPVEKPTGALVGCAIMRPGIATTAGTP